MNIKEKEMCSFFNDGYVMVKKHLHWKFATYQKLVFFVEPSQKNFFDFKLLMVLPIFFIYNPQSKSGKNVVLIKTDPVRDNLTEVEFVAKNKCTNWCQNSPIFMKIFLTK